MIRGEVAKTETLLPLGKRFEVVQKDAFVILPNGDRERISRYGLSTGPAISIVPYFRDSKTNEWRVILVSQYRPMVNEVCLEAPGSLIEVDLSPEEQMVKTAKAETGVVIAQNCIRLVGAKWLADSFSDQKVWLGAVEVVVKDQESFEQSLSGRTDASGEYEVNEVELYSLEYLLRHLDVRMSYTLTSYQLLELGIYLDLLHFSK